MPRVPTVRQISWLATIPQFLALATAVAIGWLATQSADGLLWGSAVYLVYSFGSRMLIPRAHRRGVRLSQSGQFEEAIHAHQQSYEFFTRHAWLDRFRSLTMMSPSALSFREMALLNIAFAYSQIGNGPMAKASYQRALQEFPDSGIASSALKMIASAEGSGFDTKNARP
ncbi:tetratricopeptide repeat protein [Lignipirellula cremea]|uniref:Tetratricopeptide repeat protein n=1 Tax=Lignipirellula cremea TaxID=2528010 RepID=A0A518DP69_9BACT|nr:tetratricopeptide repeat protein [Lignipirellula cremea]QDU93638.1 Tetratricopeptide repeat protein [Lignipirellula cremea]